MTHRTWKPHLAQPEMLARTALPAIPILTVRGENARTSARTAACHTQYPTREPRLLRAYSAQNFEGLPPEGVQGW